MNDSNLYYRFAMNRALVSAKVVIQNHAWEVSSTGLANQ